MTETIPIFADMVSQKGWFKNDIVDSDTKNLWPIMISSFPTMDEYIS